MAVHERTAARWVAFVAWTIGLLAASPVHAAPPAVRAPAAPTVHPSAESRQPAASAAEAPGEAAPEADPISPHPRAAIDPPEPKPEPWSFSTPLAWPEQPSRIEVAGYLLPQFQYVSFPTALPRDRQQYGARGSRVGFAMHGMPLEKWSYMAHVVVIPAGTETVALLSPTSAQGASISLSTATGTAIDIEEMTLAYRPARWFLTKLGIVRLPFTVAQTTPIPKMMLPFRAPQSRDFQSGADTGLLTTFAPFDARLQVHFGLFLGSSLGGGAPNQTVRGPALSAQVSAHPLGAMSLREGDLSRGPFRFAFGVGSIYRRATLLDPTGYEASRFNDARFAAWVRGQFKGLYAQAEYMRRLRTDDLSDRPSISEGGYVAASFFQPIGKVAFGPVGRAGVVTTDVAFAPRKFTSFEAGLAFYPRPEGDEPEKLRILVEYVHASLSPFDEVQREGLVQLQLEF